MKLFYKECKVHYDKKNIYITTPNIAEINRFDWVLTDKKVIEKYDGNFLSDDRLYLKKIIATNDPNYKLFQIPEKLIKHLLNSSQSSIQIEYEDKSYMSQDLCKIMIHKSIPYVRGNNSINFKL